MLDIGCGGGLFLGLLSKTCRVISGLGIDSSKQPISLATQMTSRLAARQGIRFEERDASAPLPSELYDVVSLLDVMHHIPPSDQRLLLERAIDRVAPSGRLVYKDMVTRPCWRAFANRLHDLVIARQWIHYLPLDKVLEWAEIKGCVALEQRTVDMLWYGHEIVVFQCRPAAAST